MADRANVMTEAEVASRREQIRRSIEAQVGAPVTIEDYVAIDHRDLLRRYMLFAEARAGAAAIGLDSMFRDTSRRFGEDCEIQFTDAEWAELKRLAGEP